MTLDRDKRCTPPRLAGVLAAIVLALSVLTGPAAGVSGAQEEQQDLNCNSPRDANTEECRNGDYGMDGFKRAQDGAEPNAAEDAGDSSGDPGGAPSGEEGSESQDAGDSGDSSEDSSGEDTAGTQEETTEGTTDGGSTDLGGAVGSADDSSDDAGGEKEPGGIQGMGLSIFKGMIKWVWDNTWGTALVKIGETLQSDFLTLPEPSGPVVDLYDELAETLRPAILVGILVVGLLMMLRSTNYDISYASFHALPRLLGVAIALAFLPKFMTIITGIADGISETFFPASGDIRSSSWELFKAGVTNQAGLNFLNIILLILLGVFSFLLVLVAMLKSIFFYVLFVAAPFALVGSVIPGLGSLAGSWFRGVLACAAIPSLWAIELGVGSFIVQQPEAVFGGLANSVGAWSNGATTTLSAILIMWLMYKTPFKVLEWAFESYTTSGGAWRNLARGVVVGTAGMAIRGAIKGAFIGGGGGGAVASAAGVASAGGGQARGAGGAGATSGARDAASSGGNAGGMMPGRSGKLVDTQPTMPGFDGRMGEGERTAGKTGIRDQTVDKFLGSNSQDSGRSYPRSVYDKGDKRPSQDPGHNGRDRSPGGSDRG